MTKNQLAEATECLTHIQAGLNTAPGSLLLVFALAALSRLETLLNASHGAADHAPVRRRRKKTEAGEKTT